MALDNYSPVITQIDVQQITPDTRIQDVPDILNQIVSGITQYMKNNLETNFSGIGTEVLDAITSEINKEDLVIKTYVDNLISNHNLELTEGMYYNINTENSKVADLAKNTQKFDGKTFLETTERIVQKIQDYYKNSPVSNSLKFNNMTLDELKNDIKTSVVEVAINSALSSPVPDSLKFDGMTSSEFVDYVLGLASNQGTNASTFEGKTKDQIIQEIQTLSEGLWDSSLFDGKNSDVWLEIIQNTIVKNSEKLEGKTYNDIISLSEDKILPQVNVISDQKIDTFSKSNAFLSKIQENSNKFDNLTSVEWVEKIKDIKIKLAETASNSDKLGNLTVQEIKQLVIDAILANTTLVNQIQNQAINWEVNSSESSQVALSLESNFKSDLVQEIIDQVQLSSSAVETAKNIIWDSLSYDLPAIAKYSSDYITAPVNNIVVPASSTLVDSAGIRKGYDEIREEIIDASEANIYNSDTGIHSFFNKINPVDFIQFTHSMSFSADPVKIGTKITYTVKITNSSTAAFSESYIQIKYGDIITQISENIAAGETTTFTGEYIITELDLVRGWCDNFFAFRGKNSGELITEYRRFV